ncbi:MAG: DNA-processing protein DprA [Bacteroidota bacterium]
MAIPELQYRIALTMMPSVGPVTARKIIKEFKSAGAFFKASPERLEKIGRNGPRLATLPRSAKLLEKAGREMEFLKKYRITAHFFGDPGYPRRLNLCNDGPFLLYARGDQGLNPAKSLSVVGTRRATSYGRDLCRELIGGLASRIPGLVIVSGLAYGIDVIAHRAALEFGLPTVAVLGHGLNTLYPASHHETAVKIIGQGALVTDFPSEMGPERNNFLRRNRIIAGMSDATLVIESAEKGGALITAHMAFSYDRPVYALPGRAEDQRSKGCNNLIKDHVAAMIESPEDLIEALNWDAGEPRGQILIPEAEYTHAEKRLLQAIDQDPGITPGRLCMQAGVPIQHILAMLLEMELKGWVSSEPGNRYRVKISLG